jgi:hypothetical protein
MPRPSEHTLTVLKKVANLGSGAAALLHTPFYYRRREVSEEVQPVPTTAHSNDGQEDERLGLNLPVGPLKEKIRSWKSIPFIIWNIIGVFRLLEIQHFDDRENRHSPFLFPCLYKPTAAQALEFNVTLYQSKAMLGRVIKFSRVRGDFKLYHNVVDRIQQALDV